MGDVASEKSRNWWSREEENVLAAIVAAGKTGLAGVAGNIWFDGNLVARLQMLDRGVDFKDLQKVSIYSETRK